MESKFTFKPCFIRLWNPKRLIRYVVLFVCTIVVVFQVRNFSSKYFMSKVMWNIQFRTVDGMFLETSSPANFDTYTFWIEWNHFVSSGNILSWSTLQCCRSCSIRFDFSSAIYVKLAKISIRKIQHRRCFLHCDLQTKRLFRSIRTQRGSEKFVNKMENKYVFHSDREISFRHKSRQQFALQLGPVSNDSAAYHNRLLVAQLWLFGFVASRVWYVDWKC